MNKLLLLIRAFLFLFTVLTLYICAWFHGLNKLQPYISSFILQSKRFHKSLVSILYHYDDFDKWIYLSDLNHVSFEKTSIKFIDDDNFFDSIKNDSWFGHFPKWALDDSELFLGVQYATITLLMIMMIENIYNICRRSD
jgi:hypothetical protein